MSALQPFKLQGVLQSEALRLCQKRQGLFKEEKAQAKSEAVVAS
jgi:hypothetical protein